MLKSLKYKQIHIITIAVFFSLSLPKAVCQAAEPAAGKAGSVLSWKKTDVDWRKNDSSETAVWRVGNNAFISNDKKWTEMDKAAPAKWREQDKVFKESDEKWRTKDSE